MEIVRQSQAHWTGDIMSGKGQLDLGSQAFSGSYSFKDRIEDSSKVTNPEELIAAAHAGCFSMALSAELSKHNLTEIDIQTAAHVTLEKTADGFKISRILLDTQVVADGASQTQLREIAEFAKRNCPVSRALASTPILLKVNGE